MSLRDGADKSVQCRKMRGLPARDSKQAIAVCSHPQRSGTILENVAHMDALGSRNGLRNECAILQLKELCRCHPETAVAPLVDGSEIGVTGHGKGNNADRRPCQAKHARLGRNPEVVLAIGKEVQHRIAGQIGGRKNVREHAIAYLEHALPDGSHPQHPVAGLPQGPHCARNALDRLETILSRRHRLQAGHRAHPQGSILRLRDGFHHVLAESVAERINPRCHVFDTSQPVSPGPQPSCAILVDRMHR